MKRKTYSALFCIANLSMAVLNAYAGATSYVLLGVICALLCAAAYTMEPN